MGRRERPALLLCNVSWQPQLASKQVHKVPHATSTIRGAFNLHNNFNNGACRVYFGQENRAARSNSIAGKQRNKVLYTTHRLIGSDLSFRSIQHTLDRGER